MNGAESLVRTLLAGGIDVCFTNPGTSEMHFVAALDSVPGMRSSWPGSSPRQIALESCGGRWRRSSRID